MCTQTGAATLLALHSLFMKQQPHSLVELKQLWPSIGVWFIMCATASRATWLCDLQTKTALSRMTREHDNVTAQMTQAEQVKLVAEGELAEVRPCTYPYLNVQCRMYVSELKQTFWDLKELFDASQGPDSNWQSRQ